MFNKENNVKPQAGRSIKPVSKRWESPAAMSTPRSSLLKAATSKRQGYQKFRSQSDKDKNKDEMQDLILTRDTIFALKFQGKIVRDD